MTTGNSEYKYCNIPLVYSKCLSIMAVFDVYYIPWYLIYITLITIRFVNDTKRLWAHIITWIRDNEKYRLNSNSRIRHSVTNINL